MGPALTLLLLGLFFPLLCLVSVMFSHSSVMVLNAWQTREASLIPAKDAQSSVGTVRLLIPNQWRTTGMGAFVNPVGLPKTEVTYKLATKDINGIQDHFVVVKTTCLMRPLVSVSFAGMSVPGLNAPLPLEVKSERLVENYKNAPQEEKK